MRNRGFLAAAAMSSLVALYFALVAGRAVIFIGTDDPVAKALGFALLVLPAIGLWWLVLELRLGMAVQRMGDILERDDRLPALDGEFDTRGRLTPEAQEAAFETAKLGVELSPDDWVAWYHVGHAYGASGDKSMARKSFRHAATLYKQEKRRA